MSLFSSLRSMFSTDTTPAAPRKMAGEEYRGYMITPAPLQDGSQFRVNGSIEKDQQSHQFIRADVLASKEECAAEMTRKAKIMIDQIGEDIFK